MQHPAPRRTAPHHAAPRRTAAHHAAFALVDAGTAARARAQVVKAAIRTLAEVEHRALTPAPYWKLPGANELIPRLKEFNTDMELLNSVLYRLIDQCLESRNPAELEDLKNKDYSKVKDPSMLRFLIDLRGEEVDNKQMRDDLITLLIAGHETTAAVLTWMTYALSQVPPYPLRPLPPLPPSSCRP